MGAAGETRGRRCARGPSRGLVLGVGAVAGVLALAACWRWTPLAAYASPDALLALAARVREVPGATLIVIGVFVVGGLVAFPVTVLTLVTVITFGPTVGVTCALIGALTSAVTAYALGAALGPERVRRIAGERIDRISRRLGRRGVLAVVAVRVVPLAPFTVVNMAAGASHIGLRDFVIGSTLGMLPGLLLTSLFADRVHAALEDPAHAHVLVPALALAAVAVTGFVLLRRLGDDTRPHRARGKRAA